MDTPLDDRGRADFNRFRAAVKLQQLRTPANLALEFAEAVGDGPEPIRKVLAGVLASQPDAIVASSHEVLEAAKALTQSVPILFMSHADPVELGHVIAIATPGVNRTGFTFYVPILFKALEIVVEAYPNTRSVGIVADQSLAASPGFANELAQVRRQSKLRVEVFLAATQEQLTNVVRSSNGRAMNAWYVPMGDAIWFNRDATLVTMQETHKPIVYDRAALARHAGALAYEARVPDPFGLWAAQLMLILSGVSPSTIPVEQPSSFGIAVALEPLTPQRRFAPSKSILKRADIIVSAP